MISIYCHITNPILKIEKNSWKDAIDNNLLPIHHDHFKNVIRVLYIRIQLEFEVRFSPVGFL
jgi:hypothetical protein